MMIGAEAAVGAAARVFPARGFAESPGGAGRFGAAAALLATVAAVAGAAKRFASLRPASIELGERGSLWACSTEKSAW